MTQKPHRVELKPPLGSRIYVVLFSVAGSGVLISLTVASRSVIPALMLVFGLGVALSVLRMSVVANTDGLTVRGGLREKRIPWREIDDFRIGSSPQSLGKAIYVLLSDGTMEPLKVTVGRGVLPRGRRQLEQQVAALRAWVRAADKGSYGSSE